LNWTERDLPWKSERFLPWSCRRLILEIFLEFLGVAFLKQFLAKLEGSDVSNSLVFFLFIGSEPFVG